MGKIFCQAVVFCSMVLGVNSWADGLVIVEVKNHLVATEKHQDRITVTGHLDVTISESSDSLAGDADFKDCYLIFLYGDQNNDQNDHWTPVDSCDFVSREGEDLKFTYSHEFYLPAVRRSYDVSGFSARFKQDGEVSEVLTRKDLLPGAVETRSPQLPDEMKLIEVSWKTPSGEKVIYPNETLVLNFRLQSPYEFRQGEISLKFKNPQGFFCIEDFLFSGVQADQSPIFCVTSRYRLQPSVSVRRQGDLINIEYRLKFLDSIPYEYLELSKVLLQDNRLQDVAGSYVVDGKSTRIVFKNEPGSSF